MKTDRRWKRPGKGEFHLKPTAGGERGGASSCVCSRGAGERVREKKSDFKRIKTRFHWPAEFINQ